MRLFLAGALYLPTLYALSQATSARSEITALWTLLIVALMALLPRRACQIMLCLGWLITPLIIGMLGYIALDGVPPSFENVSDTISETSLPEAISAFQLALHARDFVWWLAGFFGLLGLATMFAFHHRAERDDKESLRKILLAVCFLVLAYGFLVTEIMGINAPPWLISKADLRMSVPGQLGMIAFYGFAHRNDTNAKAVNMQGGEHAQAHEATQITAPQFSMLVIGESMRADGLGPQTVARGPWSKALDQRMQAGLGAWLPSVCAAHDSTVISVPALITGTAPDKLLDQSSKMLSTLVGMQTNGEDIVTLESNALKAPTGLLRLQSAGYEVGWIAAPQQGMYAGPEVFGGRGFVSQPSADANKAMYDGELLPIAEKFAEPLTSDVYSGKPKALVLHMFGSHFNYEDRYPAGLFDSEPAGLSAEDLQNLRYERANEYGAKILADVASMLDKIKTPAFAVYTSDHGENLLSDHNGLLGHVAARTSQAGDIVPALVMWNEAAKASGMPQRVLAEAVKAPRLAQLDIYRIWMSLSGLDGGEVVHPTEVPMVYGAAHLGDSFSAIPCSSLEP